MTRLIAQRYELIAEIGAGGMGTVYRGLDRQLGSPVAIKHLKEAWKEPEHFARFVREGEALRALNHPKIITMLDAVREGDDYYLILEYLPGGDLATLIRTQPLSMERVLNYAIDIADALTRAHRLNIIHRDLKPANVLLAADGTPRLTDFGIAHVESAERLTSTGAVIGTTAYLSPEALDGAEINTGMDVWSFGVLLFEMVTGRLPFLGATSSQVITSILFDPVPDVEALRPDCPIGLIDLIYRMLEKDPRGRISSVHLVGVELEATLAGKQETPSASQVESSPRSRTSSQRFNESQTRRRPYKHNLPRQAFPFVGREPELDEIAALIGENDARLITVLGPGGMGKTRLALQSAEQQVANFTHGVYLVELASLSAANMLVPTIAEAVGFTFLENDQPPLQQFLDHLSEKHMLLLLDNFEHLLPGVEIVERILQSAPQVKVIATSRERLNLSGETLYNLGGMSVTDHATTESALNYSGVQLFVQRARRVRPSYEVTTADVEAIVRICQRVEGMPLGIVLAAAWIEMLTPAEIIAELNRSIDFLETDLRDLPERQRSMRAVFDYSWRMLSEAEQAALMRLSIFQGGFTREAAEQIAGASLRALMSLMNKSLLSRNRDSGRYNLHPLTRQYAADKLRASGQYDETARHHSRYFLTSGYEIAVIWWHDGSLEARHWFDTDADNIHVAWSYAISARDATLIAQGAEFIGVFYKRIHWLEEGALLSENALAATSDKSSQTAAMLLAALAGILVDSDLFARSETLAEKAIAALRPYGMTRSLGAALDTLAYVYFCDGRFDKADVLAWEAYEIAQHFGDDFVAFDQLNWLALYARHRNDLAEARLLTEILLQTHPQDRVDPAVLLALQTLASITYMAGDVAQATDLINTTLNLARESGDYPNVAGSLIWLSIFNFGARDFPTAYEYALQGLEAANESQLTFMITTAESMLSGISVLRGDFGDAQNRLISALQNGRRLPTHRGLLRAMGSAPVLLICTGKPVEGYEIISCILNIPNVEPILQSLLTPFRQMAEANLPPEVAQAAWERGKNFDLDATVQRLLEMLGRERS
jgi:serine/threonine-protein kinase PknK